MKNPSDFPLSAQRFIFRALATTFFLSPLLLHAATDSSLFPDGRQRVELRPTERNPFTQQIAVQTTPTTAQEGTSEESRLRRILRAMKVNAVSGSKGGKRVLLGSLILEPGNKLPPILKDQAETLRVQSIEDSVIILAFVERDPAVDPRQIVLPFALKPVVSRMMLGDAFEDLAKIGPSGRIDAPPLTHPGVGDFLKGSQEADLRNLADREVQMMGVVTNAEESTESK
ncbi:MAG: hypothetical protein IAE94_15585 [Chthoniobacterales bacterium]|nr:hypothetical protein [Chthoniobacterales bacterium]